MMLRNDSFNSRSSSAVKAFSDFSKMRRYCVRSLFQSLERQEEAAWNYQQTEVAYRDSAERIPDQSRQGGLFLHPQAWCREIEQKPAYTPSSASLRIDRRAVQFGGSLLAHRCLRSERQVITSIQIRSMRTVAIASPHLHFYLSRFVWNSKHIAQAALK